MGGAVGVGLLISLFAGTAVLRSVSETRSPNGRDPARSYAIDATVLETADHAPELCAGSVAESLPPQCGGFPIAPFSWSDVDNEQSLHGTTWAEVHLVGTFDGQTFHPTAPPTPPGPRPAPEPLATSPCSTPAGGWTVVDRSKGTTADSDAVMTYASAQPDVAGIWFSWPNGLPDGDTPYRDSVVNLAFTGDLDRHEHEARALWGGPLCVSQFRRRTAELARISGRPVQGGRSSRSRRRVPPRWRPRRTRNVVKVQVLIADQVAQQWVDHRFSPGVVILDGRLRPTS